jgi:hypothetical protein
MVGLLVWKKTEKRRRSVELCERQILHVRILCAEILRGPKTPDTVLRRRVLAAVKRLQKQGIRKVILPEDFLWRDQLEQREIQPVSTVPLRQMLAADWVRWDLENRKIPSSGARVAVVCGGLSGAAVRTVTELALRHRYVMLKVPYGGEELCRQLRKEYGISLLLKPSQEQMESADVTVLFEKWGEGRGRGRLPLYDETMKMPELSLPPALEDFLPPGTERNQMLTVLLEAGAIRPGQIAFQG